MSKEIWYFDGMELSKNKMWDVEEVIEGIGIPKYRGSDIQIPFADGNKWIKKRFDRRKIVLSMWIKGKDRIELDKNIDAFMKLAGKTGLKTLRRVLRNGEVREAKAEVNGGVNFVRKRPGYAKFALEFELSDPFFYGVNLISDEYTILSNPQNESFMNLGTAPITKLKITLTGPMASPKITNLNNDIWIQYKGNISSGESIIINTNDYSCMKNEENHIAVLAHGGDPRWFILESFSNQLKIESGATGGIANFEYYPTYF